MVLKFAPGWVFLASATVLSVAMVSAFSNGSTGARDMTASVVTDASAYLAIEEYASGAYPGFCTVTSGKASCTFDGNNALAASGSGINPDSSYEFDSVLQITNKGTSTVTVDVTVGGTDSALCKVALTSAADQSAATYAADPTGISTAKDAVRYLGLGFAGTGKTASQSVACTITVTAA